MKITVVFYAYTQELAQQDRYTFSIPPSSTVEQAWTLLSSLFPKLAPLKETLAFAVGTEYVLGQHRLQEGDTLSIIPPVSGG